MGELAFVAVDSIVFCFGVTRREKKRKRRHAPVPHTICCNSAHKKRDKKEKKEKEKSKHTPARYPIAATECKEKTRDKRGKKKEKKAHTSATPLLQQSAKNTQRACQKKKIEQSKSVWLTYCRMM